MAFVCLFILFLFCFCFCFAVFGLEFFLAKCWESEIVFVFFLGIDFKVFFLGLPLNFFPDYILRVRVSECAYYVFGILDTNIYTSVAALCLMKWRLF